MHVPPQGGNRVLVGKSEPPVKRGDGPHGGGNEEDGSGAGCGGGQGPHHLVGPYPLLLPH